MSIYAWAKSHYFKYEVNICEYILYPVSTTNLTIAFMGLTVPMLGVSVSLHMQPNCSDFVTKWIICNIILSIFAVGSIFLDDISFIKKNKLLCNQVI